VKANYRETLLGKEQLERAVDVAAKRAFGGIKPTKMKYLAVPVNKYKA
jgi:hypothetical protein